MALRSVFTTAQITDQVNKISRSSILKNSPVLRQFLHFVVDETLEGNGERIKEYTIGTMVLGRKTDFDPQLDAIVRIHAGRLRRALNEFYAGEGKTDQMRINIPKGGYTPEFTLNGQIDNFSELQRADKDQRRKPVLAVMPFRNISQDSSFDFFCQGIGEFVSTELSHFQELTLISYSLCESTAGKTKDVYEMHSLLGAEYILTGSVFFDHHNLRILLQLSRGDSGKQLWSSTFIHKVDEVNLFEIQEEIVNLITGSLGGYYGVIYRDVLETSRNGARTDQEAYNVIFWYDQFTRQFDYNTFHQACDSLELTLKKDPDYALALAVLSELYVLGVVMGFKRSDNQQEAAFMLANKAVKLDPLCQHAHQALARSFFLTRNKSGVISASERCYALNPRSAWFAARIGVFLIYAGEFERGASILKESLKSNPYFPWMSSLAFSLYHYHRKEFRESWDWAQKVDMPQVPWVCLLKAASLAQLGELEKAKKEAEQLLVAKPDITVLGKPYIGTFIFDESLVDSLIAGLEKTGLMMRNTAMRITS